MDDGTRTNFHYNNSHIHIPCSYPLLESHILCSYSSFLTSFHFPTNHFNASTCEQLLNCSAQIIYSCSSACHVMPDRFFCKIILQVCHCPCHMAYAPAFFQAVKAEMAAVLPQNSVFGSVNCYEIFYFYRRTAVFRLCPAFTPLLKYILYLMIVYAANVFHAWMMF